MTTFVLKAGAEKRPATTDVVEARPPQSDPVLVGLKASEVAELREHFGVDADSWTTTPNEDEKKRVAAWGFERIISHPSYRLEVSGVMSVTPEVQSNATLSALFLRVTEARLERTGEGWATCDAATAMAWGAMVEAIVLFLTPSR